MFVSPDILARFRADAQSIQRLAGPLVVNNLVLAGMGVTNTIAAGRVGPEPLAGVAVGVSYYQIFWLAGLGVLMSPSALVAHAYGAGDDRDVGHRLRQGLWLSQMIALPLLVALLFVEPVLQWFGTDPRTIPHASAYVLTLCFGMPAMLAYLAHRYTTEGIGWTRPIMFTAALGLAVNIVGNWVFTLGHLGVPALGARGCAIATVLAQWTMLVSMHVYQRRHAVYRRFGLFSRQPPVVFVSPKAVTQRGLPSTRPIPFRWQRSSGASSVTNRGRHRGTKLCSSSYVQRLEKAVLTNHSSSSW
jgi:MATE family multidrug resistance protein